MMNEQEIIKYLKENKNKGVAFAFMPREVGLWCCEHRNEEIFHMFYYSSWNGKCGINCRDNAIYCLDEDYELKPETHYKELDEEREEMNEQEIIEYLKENRKKGVAFAFMPGDVQNWCEEHCDETIFHTYIYSSTWRTLESSILCKPQEVYCLPTAYKPKPKFKPYCQEFDIDDDGCFEFEGKKYYYSEKVRFETENRDRFRGFGGWLYEGKETFVWTTAPQLLLYGDMLCDSMRSERTQYEKGIPIPTKIRFWRYAE